MTSLFLQLPLELFWTAVSFSCLEMLKAQRESKTNPKEGRNPFIENPFQFLALNNLFLLFFNERKRESCQFHYSEVVAPEMLRLCHKYNGR